MRAFEKEVFLKIKKDFSRLKKKRKFTKRDADKLVTDVTGLIGIYAGEYNKELAQLIEEMISFGEYKNWSLAGPRYQFDKLNKKYNV